MTYGNVHRFFLRTIASQGVLKIPDAQSLLERFTDEGELSVTDIVRAINNEIRPYHQEIKLTKDEVTDEDVIVFLSLADDAATKAQNLFSATELEYFRVLIEQIMSTEARQITKINAMNLVSSMKSSFTKTDAQKVLNTWCRMHYFEKEQDNYALGLKAIHEFEGYFRQNMEQAVEECYLCKHIVFRGYNCPGCVKAIHSRCLNRYLEKVQKWPCCKIDFDQEQLERLNNESSRLPPTQLLDTTPHSEEYTVTEPTQTQESTQVQEASEIMDEDPEVIPEISQRVPRKRKRQTSPQAQNPTSRRSLAESAAAAPTQDVTSRRSSRDSTVEAPTEFSTARRSTRNSIVARPVQVTTTRRNAKISTVAAPKQVTTPNRSTRNNTVAAPQQVATTRRSTRNNTVEDPTEVTTSSRSAKSGTVAAPTQVPSTRRTRSNIVEEPVTEIQKSLENMKVKEESLPPKVTRKRK